MTVKKRVLVIDDDAAVRFTIARLLSAQSYEVEIASNGSEADRAIQVFRPDLVITDIIMPEKEGIETILHIKARYGNIKIVAISGGGRLGAEDLLEMASRLGADHVLSKPFESIELLRVVKECFDVVPMPLRAAGESA